MFSGANISGLDINARRDRLTPELKIVAAKPEVVMSCVKEENNSNGYK